MAQAGRYELQIAPAVRSPGLFSSKPCKILYSIEEDHIFVIAVAHQHRKPDYWMDK